jgi:hypothetical protein
MDRSKEFAFNKTIITTLALVLSVIVVIAFLRNVLTLNGPTVYYIAYYIAECLGNLCEVFGIMLFLTGRGFAGISLMFVQVAQIVVTRLLYSMSVVNDFFFWLFAAVLIAASVVFWWPPRGTGTKPK